MALQRLTDLRARSVQQDALVGLADLERRADLLRGEPADVPERDDRALAFRQPLDRVAHDRGGLAGEQPRLRQRLPSLRGRAPMTGPARMRRVEEPRGIDG